MKLATRLFRFWSGVLMLILLLAPGVNGVAAQDSTFTVTTEDQKQTHPHYNEGYKAAKFAINGSQDPDLTLKRGNTYYFVMDNVPSFHPFYITTDPDGGSEGEGEYSKGVTNNGATGNDTLTFRVPADAPNTLYYNCTSHEYMGASISITGTVSQKTFHAKLSGNHEVSPVATKAHGKVTATLSGDQLTVTGSFDNLSSQYVASHIHIAYAGRNGGVEIPLDVTVDADGMGGTFVADSNTYTLTADQKQALMERRMYVNVHSKQHPAGEIRGQLLAEADAYYRAHLSGTQVAPFGVKSRGHGMVVAELHSDTLKVSGSFADMPSAYTMSHIHMAPAGRNGGVLQGLSASLNTDSTAGTYAVSKNSIVLSPSQQTALQERRLYVNLHSKNHPASALRGQLVAQTRATFVARLASSNQQPPFNSGGNGTVLFELHHDTLKAFGTFNDLASNFASGVAETGTHLHAAVAGRNGPIDIHLNAQASADMRAGIYMPSNNTFELSSSQIDRLYQRGYYVNIHSQDHQAGALRGQVLPPATAYFRAQLSGMHEVQPVQTKGTGAVVAEVKDSTVILTGAFQGLSSTFNADLRQGSHLHAAGIGANGGIQVELSAMASTNDTAGVYRPSANTFTLGSQNLNKLYMGGLYANIHSEAHAAGEIRGQLRFSPNRYPDTTMITSPSDSASVTIQGSGSNTVTVEWNQVSDTDGSRLAYIWQVSTDASFSNTLMSMNLGSQTMANISYRTLDSLVAGTGLMVGESTTLHHRVLSSDGSLMARSEGKALVVMRDTAFVNIPEQEDQLPDQVVLRENYPNPFNPATTIEFGLPRAQKVRIDVYNLMGRRVATIVNRRYGAGNHKVTFNADNLSSGVYLYRLTTPTRTLTRKMTLLK